MYKNNVGSAIQGSVYFQSQDLSKIFMQELERMVEIASNILNKPDPSIIKVMEKIIDMTSNFNLVSISNATITENNIYINNLKAYKQSVIEIFKKNINESEEASLLKSTLLKFGHSIEQLMYLNDNMMIQNISQQIKQCINQLKLFYGEIAVPKSQFIENAKFMISISDKLVQLVRMRSQILVDEILSNKMSQNIESMDKNIKNMLKTSSLIVQGNSTQTNLQEEKETLTKNIGQDLKDLINLIKFRNTCKVDLVIQDRDELRHVRPTSLRIDKDDVRGGGGGSLNRNNIFQRNGSTNELKKISGGGSVKISSTSTHPKVFPKDSVGVLDDGFFQKDDNKVDIDSFREESLRIANLFEVDKEDTKTLSRLSTETNFSSGETESDENEIFQFLMDISSGSNTQKKNMKKERISILEFAGKLSRKKPGETDNIPFARTYSNNNLMPETLPRKSEKNDLNGSFTKNIEDRLNSSSNGLSSNMSNSFTLQLVTPISNHSFLSILSLLECNVLKKSETELMLEVEVEFENEKITVQKEKSMITFAAFGQIISLKQKFCKAVEIYDLGLRDGGSGMKDSLQKVVDPLVNMITDLNKQITLMSDNMRSFQENTDIKFKKLQEGPVEKYSLSIPKDLPFVQPSSPNTKRKDSATINKKDMKK